MNVLNRIESFVIDIEVESEFSELHSSKYFYLWLALQHVYILSSYQIHCT